MTLDKPIARAHKRSWVHDGDCVPRARCSCVHYCLPGVVDTWTSFFENLLASPRLRAAMGADEKRLGAGAGANIGVGRVAGRQSRFFAANASEWLRVKGYAERLEACVTSTHMSRSTRPGHLGKASCESRLQLQPWWAFRCIEQRDRRVVRAPDFGTTWTPWMPAESFD